MKSWMKILKIYTITFILKPTMTKKSILAWRIRLIQKISSQKKLPRSSWSFKIHKKPKYKAWFRTSHKDKKNKLKMKKKKTKATKLQRSLKRASWRRKNNKRSKRKQLRRMCKLKKPFKTLLNKKTKAKFLSKLSKKTKINQPFWTSLGNLLKNQQPMKL